MIAVILSAVVVLFQGCQVHALSTPPTVDVRVYYEALCPDSIKFITKQMWPAWQKLKDHGLNIDFVPYGKASTFPSGDGFSFKCQHGPRECKGNLYQACLLDKIRPEQAPPLVNCIMGSPHLENSTQECINALGVTSLSYWDVDICHSSMEGQWLLKLNGDLTKVVRSHESFFIPWITFNGVWSKETFDGALHDFFGTLCKNFLQGASPCNDLLTP